MTMFTEGSLKIKSNAGATSIAFIILLAQVFAAEAAEVKVLCAGAIAPIMNELVPRFERETGHKLAIRYEFGPVLKRQIEGGEAFDVAILSLDINDLIKQGKLAADTRVALGRTGVGVGVRKGAPKPDIGTTEAFKRTLLNAKSVAYGKEAPTGVHFIGLLARLGIAEDMKAKLRPYPVPGSVEAVAAGEAEIVVNGTVVIAAVPGVELVGGLPPELQTYVVFTAGVSATAKEEEAGKALLHFLTAPEAAAVFKAKGLEPGTPR
jgi:molybdate transport system substrate-binding protein